MAKIQYLKNYEDVIIYPVTHERAVKDSNGVLLETKLNNKQNTLVSGVNIKTVKGNSLLGPGNIVIKDGANVLFYTGSFYNNGGTQTIFDPNAETYWVLNSSENFGGLVAKAEDIVLFFANTILYVTVATTNVVNNSENEYLQVVSMARTDLKGDTGAIGPIGPAGITSVVATVDDSSGTPSVLASVSNQVLTLIFSGLKGIQGDSGYQGSASELEIVNNLTDGGTTSALSAEMGKTLNESIPNLITLTEAAYDLLVANDTVDPDGYYFIYED